MGEWEFKTPTCCVHNRDQDWQYSPHIALQEVDSTNSEAIRQLHAGQPLPFWLTARQQTSGRGRRGRPWISQEGNLYATFVIETFAGADINFSQLPLVIAIALHRAIADVIGPQHSHRLQVKWPNDLLFDCAKIAGILIETDHFIDTRVAIIGTGVNCSTHPVMETLASNFRQFGLIISLDELLTAYRRTMDETLYNWRTHGFSLIRQAWLARAVGIGKKISVRLPNETLHGVFERLDDDGYLVLALSGGEHRKIASGDVFLYSQPT